MMFLETDGIFCGFPWLEYNRGGNGRTTTSIAIQVKPTLTKMKTTQDEYYRLILITL